MKMVFIKQFLGLPLLKDGWIHAVHGVLPPTHGASPSAVYMHVLCHRTSSAYIYFACLCCKWADRVLLVGSVFWLAVFLFLGIETTCALPVHSSRNAFAVESSWGRRTGWSEWIYKFIYTIFGTVWFLSVGFQFFREQNCICCTGTGVGWRVKWDCDISEEL